MATTTRDRTATILLSLLFLVAVTGSFAGKITEEEKGKEKGLFVLGKFKSVIKNEEGEIKVVSGYRWRGDPSPMHIGFIDMEPNTLLIPQYIDANLVIFVRSGHARIGWMCKDRMAERRLRAGDVSVIPAGSAFYLINNCRDQRLQIIASIDSSESLGFSSPHSFFIGGGIDPTSILSGFDPDTITSAFNVTGEELGIMMSQAGGPIVRINPHEQKTETDIDIDQDEEDGEEENKGSKWKRFLDYVLGRHHHHHHHHKRGRKDGLIRAPHAYNLYDRKPDFWNRYGSSIAVDENEYAPLEHTGISVYFVNLTAGSMMAPHLNPTATEYGIVLGGIGSIQVVFPNGTMAMNAEVSEGDVFWVPRYFPFCQVASRGGPLEFFGFTTSSHRNHPQFLTGRRSVLRMMRGSTLAAAFNVSKEWMDWLLRAQHEEVILPMRAPDGVKEKRIEEEVVVLMTPDNGEGKRVGDGEGEEVMMMSRRFMFA